MSDKTRLGITVTKKFGKAHHRNKFKRRVKEAFRVSKNYLIRGVDLVIRPRASLDRITFAGVVKELIDLTGANDRETASN